MRSRLAVVISGVVAVVAVVGAACAACADRTRDAALARLQLIVDEQQAADADCDARVGSEPSPSAVAAGCLEQRARRLERYQGLLTMLPPGHQGTPAFPDVSAAVAAAPKDDDGKRLFVTLKCSGCHSIDGTPLAGSSMKGLYGSTVQHADGSSAVVDDAYLREALLSPDARVTKGFTPVMPSYAGENAATLDVVIAYIKSLSVDASGSAR